MADYRITNNDPNYERTQGLRQARSLFYISNVLLYGGIFALILSMIMREQFHFSTDVVLVLTLFFLLLGFIAYKFRKIFWILIVLALLFSFQDGKIFDFISEANLFLFILSVLAILVSLGMKVWGGFINVRYKD